jgi:beta-lactamase regulating signal transducer with metallopeptidase domain
MFGLSFWFVLRASLLLMISGVCVAFLSRLCPLTSARWHRFAWGAVLLQGLVFVPFSLTIETPEWLSKHGSVAGRRAEREVQRASRLQESQPRTALPVAVQRVWSHAEAADASQLHHHSLKGREAGAGFAWASQHNHQQQDDPAAVDPGTSRDSSLRTGSIPADEPGSFFLAPHSALNTGAPELLITQTADASTNPSALAFPWADWLVTVWICGIFGFAGLGLLNYVALNIALMKARPARRSWAKELQDLSLELNLDHSVALDVHPVIGPLICWVPSGHRIVVPVGLWSELSSEERVAVLHHELSHLRRGDLWKSMLARFILVLHWFNPLAWISTRRFDESAEWACDSLMATEHPARVTQLANALLAATTARDGSPILALSATGGPLFQRIRRLVSWDHQGDSVMQRLIWCGLLCPLVLLGLVQLEFTAPLAAQTSLFLTESSPTDETAGKNASADSSGDATHESAQESARLKEFTDRIIVGNESNLKKFIELMNSPVGQIVIADRAAIQAQNATDDQDAVTQWQQFVASHFKDNGSTITLNADFQSERDAFVRSVQLAEADISLILPVFLEVGAALDTTTEPAQILQRFLKHEGAPALVYVRELRSRLHPGIEDLSEVFAEQLVRSKDGRFVIRPARRSKVEKQLKTIERVQPMLKRFEEELAAWGEDLANPDQRHGDLKAILANPNFALFIASGNLSEEEEPNDEQFDGIFYQLEEATSDAPAGLMLDVESEQLKEIDAEIARFTAIQEKRSVLEEPLQELVNRLAETDDLHRRLKSFLKTDLALMIVAHEMDYSPVSADEAAREWLSNYVTLDENGKYTITSESPDDLVSQAEDFFQQFREVRRRGRMFDEFAQRLTDQELRSAIHTFSGKLTLVDLVESAAKRPDVDGLQLWFDAHFEETAEGLKLFDYAGSEIDGVLEEAAELEKQLSKSDF